MRKPSLTVTVAGLLLLMACSGKTETVEHQKDLNSFRYSPTDEIQDGLSAKVFSDDWSKILVFDSKNISSEQEKFLSELGLCVQIELPQERIITGLYKTKDGDYGGFVAKIEKSSNVIRQLKKIYHQQNRLIILRQNPSNFYIGNRFETEFDSQVSYDNIEKFDPIPE